MNHTAVWTGSEMVLWGGRVGSSGFLSDGARYNPASDTWAVTTTVAGPTARYGHSAVWIGSEMLVSGGAGGTLFAG